MINKQKWKHCSDSKTFIEFSNSVDDIQKNITKYNPSTKTKNVHCINDMIADKLSNEKRQAIKTELFIRGRNLVCLLFSSQYLILISQKLLDWILHITLSLNL